MIKKLHATINFDTKDNHPDEPGAAGLSYSDTYTIDAERFTGYDSIQSYIRRDLALVAGGGYDTDTISNVKFNIRSL